MTNKEKNARLVTFKEDYASQAGKKAGEVIYKKGTQHAIHKTLVKQLTDKGAKMDVKDVPVDSIVKRAKAARAANLKKETAK